MAWNDLTIPQRSQLMNIYRQNGITSLSEMKRLYDLSSSPSPFLVETDRTAFGNAAPMYAEGGKIPPQGGYVYEEDNPQFVGPVLPKSAYNGPEVPYGFYDAPIDWERKKALQHYNESSFKANQKSPAGAEGPYQIMPANWKHYSKKLGLQDSAQDYHNSEAVRDTMMDELLRSKWVNKGHPSDSVRAAKALMAYNWGSGNATKFLENMKNQGVEIYHSMDWIDKIPAKETRNYINYILREKDISGGKTIKAFEKALPHRFDAYPEAKRYDMGGPTEYLFVNDGPVRRQYNGENITEEKYKELQRQAIINAAVNKALTRNEGIAPIMSKGKLGDSCIYTATDNYGKQYRVAGNQSLSANPSKYGFKVAGILDENPENNIGRLYQFIDADRIPRHMGLITGIKDGKPLISYSQGEAQQLPADKDYKKNENVWLSPWYETYKFVGTPEDNAKWSEEYNALPAMEILPKLQFDNLIGNINYKSNGNLFWPGGPINPKIIRTKLKNAALSLLPKNVSKGLASVASFTYGDILGILSASIN